MVHADWQRTSLVPEGNGDEWVQKAEFKMLLGLGPGRGVSAGRPKSAFSGNLFYFNKLYWLFDQVRSAEPRTACSDAVFDR